MSLLLLLLLKMMMMIMTTTMVLEREMVMLLFFMDSLVNVHHSAQLSVSFDTKARLCPLIVHKSI